MASRLLTRTSLYQPARTRCASPSASLASVLLARISSARWACRASRHTIGSRRLLSSVQSQVVKRPGLEADPHRTRRMLADGRLEFVGMARTLTAPDAHASFVKNVNLRLFQ